MRKLASLVVVSEVKPLPGADNIEVAKVRGKEWSVVVKKGSFKVGDEAIFFEIDSYLPIEERYKFLEGSSLREIKGESGEVEERGYRLKTMRMRGQVSQGLLLPFTEFPELEETGLVEGDDVSAELHVRHFDEVYEAVCPKAGALKGDIYGNFPSFHIPKTDEERIQNLGDYFESMKGRWFQVTEKADGMSVTMFYSPRIDDKTPFGVCSRNYRMKETTEAGTMPVAWEMAKKYKVEEVLKKRYEVLGQELAIQGEVVGPKINGNRDNRKGYDWLVFKIYDIRKDEYVNPEEAYKWCESMGLNHVKVIDRAVNLFDYYTDIDMLMKYAEGKTDNGNEREGIVCKSIDGVKPFVSFKVVSNKYLEKIEKAKK